MDEIAARRAFETALKTQQPAFEKLFLARFFGLEFTYTDDACRVEFPVSDFMFNSQGTVHGGVTAFVLDSAMGHLLKHAVGPGTTLEMKVQYLAPVRPPRATCEAKFLRKGQRIAFLEARLWDGEGTLAAVATSTWRVNRAEAQ
ncbi:MAG TPA: hotdog domain-containing protein [Hyphomicrobiaceae bacterium]|jgi:uncharacterized protein (TIGR00369 family)|nr:MAG: thioesterase [Pseudomonadota bacterium]HEX5600802.1 hotdog domain-containing protein [Hyphomicrobiaceae bacterium]